MPILKKECWSAKLKKNNNAKRKRDNEQTGDLAHSKNTGTTSSKSKWKKTESDVKNDNWA